MSEERLEAGDRVLFFTDGIIEEHLSGGELFGETRLVDLVEEVSKVGPFRKPYAGCPTLSSVPEEG